MSVSIQMTQTRAVFRRGKPPFCLLKEASPDACCQGEFSTFLFQLHAMLSTACLIKRKWNITALLRHASRQRYQPYLREYLNELRCSLFRTTKPNCSPAALKMKSVCCSGTMPWLVWAFAILMTLAVLTSAAGIANAGCVRFSSLFSFIKNLQLRRAVITVILLGIAAFGASLGMGVLTQKVTSYIGYAGILGLVIPAFTIVRSKLKKGE